MQQGETEGAQVIVIQPVISNSPRMIPLRIDGQTIDSSSPKPRNFLSPENSIHKKGKLAQSFET